MSKSDFGLGRSAWFVFLGLWLIAGWLSAQEDEPGHSIGKVSTKGDLIVVELDEGALGKANLFDLTGHTIRFMPEGSRYRIEIQPLQWDSEYGPELRGVEANLQNFAFPFSGKSWKSFSVGANGSIRFGATEKEGTLDPYGHRDGGIVLDRFDELAEAASHLADKAPAICVFLKPRLYGPHYVKELADRVVITWDLSEPFGGLLDFTWYKTSHRFQAVLHRDGSIEMSYRELAAKDGIVGIFPVLTDAARATAVHFSALKRGDGPYTAVYEAFHYVAVPKAQDLSCTVIKALGDKFDFLAYYSDFRIDSQEASTPSDGPIGGSVSGIGNTQHAQTPQVLASRCTQGRFQLGFAQPVYVGANEAQEGPPEDAPVGSTHDITFYLHRRADGLSDRRVKALSSKAIPYNYAVGHLGHEVGHRWGAYASAKIHGETVALGEWPHWAPGLQARVAFPYSLPTEASTLGGGVWQENPDGTYTQLRDGFFVPATGYSYLDLYLMGLRTAAEVPEFFVLKNLARVGDDAQGHPVFKAEKVRVTVRDVIAAEGPRVPDAEHSQKKFHTGFVMVVEHGQKPSAELVERVEGIRRQWIQYWESATGHRAAMTADPK